MASESSTRTISSQVRRACLGFDVKDRAKVNSLASVLNSAAQELTKGEHVRYENIATSSSSHRPRFADIPIDRRTTGQDQALWVDLRRIWRDIARTQLTFWDNDDDDSDEEEDYGGSSENNHLRNLCQAIGKFTRNIVAGVPDNQARA
jgi:ataxin-10